MIIEVNKINEVYAILKCDTSIAREISEYFSFFATGYKFIPSFREKLWDGKIRLAKLLPNGDIEFPIGLLKHLKIFSDDAGYEIQLNYQEEKNTITRTELAKFVLKLNLHSRGTKIEIRDYQFNGVLNFLNSKGLVLLSPTSSGKSLILYIIIRYLLEHKCKKGLLLVPNTSLCHQLASDFADYSSHNGWNADENIHTIFAGKEKNAEKPILLSTWQSLFNHHKKDKNYFNQFDFAMCDEVHLAAANSLSGILQKCINASYRIGVTGTLNGTKVHSLQLESLFGPVEKVITTKELMDNKQVTKLHIKCLVLKYPEEIRKCLTKLKYQEEIDFLVSNEARNKFIRNLALSLKGNTLLLYQLVEKHGEVLFDLISKSKHAKDKQIYFIHGNINALERERIRNAMETEQNVILIGSVGTVSTGTNIKNLHNIIFASPSKSRIRNLQAVGRVLRLNENKDKATLYDIADDLRHKKHQNYTILHFQERIKVYNEEKFDYKIINVDLEPLKSS